MNFNHFFGNNSLNIPTVQFLMTTSQLEELIEEECQARKDDFQVLLPSTITSQTWNVIHDHNVNIFRSTFCQSFVVSMETEIHERIINDRRTMVVVDDDRWIHHPSLMKFCDTTTLQLMTMINQWWRNWYINMHICRSFKWKLIEDGYCIWQQELKWKLLISWRYAAKSNLEKLRIDLEDENLRLRFAKDNFL